MLANKKLSRAVHGSQAQLDHYHLTTQVSHYELMLGHVLKLLSCTYKL